MLVATLAVAGAACGDDDDDVGEVAGGVCDALGNLQSDLDAVAGSDIDLETTTVGDVTSALDTLQSGVEDVQDAEENLDDSVRSDLQDAYDSYQDAIADVPDDATLSEAGDAVAAAQSDLAQAWQSTLDEASCE